MRPSLPAVAKPRPSGESARQWAPALGLSLRAFSWRVRTSQKRIVPAAEKSVCPSGNIASPPTPQEGPRNVAAPPWPSSGQSLTDPLQKPAISALASAENGNNTGNPPPLGNP